MFRGAVVAAGVTAALGGLVTLMFLVSNEGPIGRHEFGVNPGSWTLLGGLLGALPGALRTRPFKIRENWSILLGAALGFAVGFLWWLGTIIART